MNGLQKMGVSLVRKLPAEPAHKTAIHALRLNWGPKGDAAAFASLKTSIAGLTLPNPVGLAAGFDKDAQVPDAMLRAGFGFVECGTVTPRPQAGNAKPRLFRLKEDRAVINRMGFNNRGLDHFKDRLTMRAGRCGIVGANLGANKDSDDRAADYVTGLQALWGLCDYFTVNISSPNTPGLRKLQSGNALEDLLGRVQEERERLTLDKPTPIFVKVAPDLEPNDIDAMVETAVRYKMDALIVSNTTLARPKSLASKHKGETGGLSGAPLFERSTKILADFAAASAGRMPLIGVGGISNGAQAYAKIRAGASAVQLYSALAYQGPELVGTLCDDLAARLTADGFESISDAVGAA